MRSLLNRERDKANGVSSDRHHYDDTYMGNDDESDDDDDSADIRESTYYLDRSGAVRSTLSQQSSKLTLQVLLASIVLQSVLLFF